MQTPVLTILGCSLLMGCSHSPHKNYYLLNAVSLAPQTRATPPQAISQFIGIGPIEIADYLNRQQIVFNSASESAIKTNLTLADNDYWAEPLAKAVARVLALNLMQRNISRSFSFYPWRNDNKPPLSLRVQINSLTRINNQASIIATWELINQNSKKILVKQHFIRTLPVAQGTDNLVQAYSQLVQNMAEEMDMALQNFPQ